MGIWSGQEIKGKSHDLEVERNIRVKLNENR